jgi:hypothetical protein
MTRKPYVKENGYETEHLIDSLSDGALLAHMGVPLMYVPHAVRMSESGDLYDPEINDWLDNLPFIFRPSFDRMMEKPNLCGSGLVLYGPPSSHKTTTAAALLLYLARRKIPNTDPTGKNFTWHGAAMGRFVDWQEASASFRSASSDEDEDVAADEIRRAMIPNGPMTTRGDFLVIDDISRERPSDYNKGELQRTIRRRSSEGFPTIITTNLEPEEWAEFHGAVLAGYLARHFVPVPFGGDSWA